MKWSAVFRHKNAIRLYSLLLGVGLWELVARITDSPVLPGPLRVFTTLVEAFIPGGIPNNSPETLGVALLKAFIPMFVGYLLALVTGVLLGLMMGIDRRLERILDPFVNALYVAPISALVPVLIFWFGLDFAARVVIIYIFVVFVIVVNTLQGAKHTPADYVELVRSFGGSRGYLIRHVVIPHAIPYIMVGMRLGIGRALRGVVVSELILSMTGIGIIVSNYNGYFRIDGLLAVAISIMAIGIVLAGVVQWLENVIAPWKKKEAAFLN